MDFTPTHIPDVIVIDPLVHEDGRGFLMETWQADRFRAAGIDANFVQDVHSRSTSGTVRGLHYQISQAQGKLIRVIRGEAFDVAVDLRKSSATFGRWVGEILSEENRKLIWVPPGFAHGFMVLSDVADFEYRMTDYHAPEYARSIRWDDPDIAIAWPSEPGRVPLMSEADSNGVAFKNAEVYA
ncbi:MAG: dTDP-4-dehydrorhamnose 3,5-epimerase [Proteobacteria bacterium]|jgi:dTDP-4-dehydrorhamnose 3,5-epimerase|nr:dTDP-4-dehydrorhamnose 3,5-epimerase [Pseudomonadota bacterium]MDA0993528.1 dTDP-4-dehydrorhamnose 3,5-epimerase [Pseudomonadota bacterium]